MPTLWLSHPNGIYLPRSCRLSMTPAMLLSSPSDACLVVASFQWRLSRLCHLIVMFPSQLLWFYTRFTAVFLPDETLNLLAVSLFLHLRLVCQGTILSLLVSWAFKQWDYQKQVIFFCLSFHQKRSQNCDRGTAICGPKTVSAAHKYRFYIESTI